jgi:two-component system phosphate regulon sensor histidine kinase PhoR
VGSQTYQVVSRLGHVETGRGRLRSVAGFMVNLGWVREHYFGGIAQQISHITRADSALTFSLTQAAYANERARPESVAGTRTLLMAFFDPLVVAIDKPPDLTLEQWTITAHATSDDMLDSARAGTRQTLFIALISVLVFATGLALTLRATRTEAALTRLRADFVSTVTHELKTPVAAIRAAADTLVSYRVSSDDPPRKYAHMIVEQSQQLTRLLENMLAYARITDLTKAYSFTAVSVGELVDEVITHAQLRLERGKFDLSVHVPAGLPRVRADRTALYLAFENLIDNAIRYSRLRRSITVSAVAAGPSVRIEVADRGMGIPAAELPQVMQRFFRGSGAGPGGTGLGLAIVQRILLDHQGTVAIESEEGVGTTVSVTLPIATTP